LLTVSRDCNLAALIPKFTHLNFVE